MTAELEEPKLARKELIRIMPFFNPQSVNMGLTDQKMVIMDGIKQKESLTYIEVNKGVRRYLTGLNEFAPEINTISDKEQKKEAIMAIRKKVQYLEKVLGGNDVPLDAPDFMKQVVLIHPNNYTFWDTIEISAGNEPEFLNSDDANHFILICCIEAGGFSMISKSYEDAKTSANPPKWYLDKHNETASSKVEVKKLKNKAASLLTGINDKDPKKLFYIIKNIDPNSYQYRNHTSPDTIYEYLDEHIAGRGFQKVHKKAAEEFINFAKLPIEDLRIKAIIADASFYRIIYAKADQMLYHAGTESRLGRNISEVFTYLKDALNSKIWDSIRQEVESKWGE